jgi:tRNA pseudouridine55 synthase
LDAEGKLVEERPLDGVTPERVRDAILSFAGEYRQRVPEFAAVKVGGVPAYRLARRGEPVPERERIVRLWDLAVESVALPLATFHATCSAGTYMRSLAADVGAALEVGAHVTELRRLRCGPLFTLGNSITLTEIEERTAKGDSAMVRNPAEFLTGHLPLTVGEDHERYLREGRAIPLSAATNREPARIGAPAKALRPGGALVAVGEIVAGGPGALSFHPSKVLI